jgi:hypothetical protein
MNDEQQKDIARATYRHTIACAELARILNPPRRGR